MDKRKIIAITIGVIGLALVALGFSYKISFKNSQESLVTDIEANFDKEEHLIDVPEKALDAYEKASKADPEQFPPIPEDELKEYRTKKAKTTGILEIPSIKIKAGVIEGVSPKELAISAGRYTTSATPDQEEGNLVIAAHVSGPVPVFENLKDVKVGDKVFFHYKGNTYTYVIKDKFVAEPDQTEILNSTPGKKTITLFTCTNKGKQRTVATGEMIN